MKNYKMIIEYDGTRYDGWQGQSGKSGNYIADRLNGVLSEMTHEKVEIIGAARTEAGVHAYAQSANVKMNTDKKYYEIEQYLNRYLPRDIAVLEVSGADERFHAAFSAKGYVYEYKITMGEVPSVFDRKYNYYCFKQLNITDMKKAAMLICGEHDMKAFSDNRKMKKSTVRIIHNIDIYATEKEVSISMHGDDFWPNMARIITGTLVEVGKGTIKPEEITDIIKSGDREKAGETIDAKGLFLAKVVY